MENPDSLKCRAVLFDLDGTLVDSAALLHRLWKWWADRRGVSLDALLAVMAGRTALETIRLVAPHLQAEAEIEALETEEVSDMHDVYIYPGARELLEKLGAAPWAIVTSGSRRVAEARIRHVGLPIPPLLVTAEMIDSGKPDPDCYLLAAQMLGLQPQDCVVIEDAPVGIQAGKAAGMRVIAIASTHTAADLQEADAIIASLPDMDMQPSATGTTIHLAG